MLAARIAETQVVVDEAIVTTDRPHLGTVVWGLGGRFGQLRWAVLVLAALRAGAGCMRASPLLPLVAPRTIVARFAVRDSSPPPTAPSGRPKCGAVGVHLVAPIVSSSSAGRVVRVEGVRPLVIRIGPWRPAMTTSRGSGGLCCGPFRSLFGLLLRQLVLPTGLLGLSLSQLIAPTLCLRPH